VRAPAAVAASLCEAATSRGLSVEQERARLVALLDRSEAMLAELASRDDPALFAVVVDLQRSVLQLRAQVATLDSRAQRLKSDE
jgi:hypothetical protein